MRHFGVIWIGGNDFGGGAVGADDLYDHVYT